MEKRKWTFWSFEANEMGALSAYLEQMAEKGWFPDKIGEWGIVFYEEEPEERRYAAAFVPGGSFMTGPDSYEARVMRERCGKAGNFSAEVRVFRYFMPEAESFLWLSP